MDPYSSYFQLVPYGVEIVNRVFVGGLSYSMTEWELKEFFGQFGTVRDSKIITDREGKSKGYGFVTFGSEEEAMRVYTKGSLYYKEKKLNVSKAIRKHGGQYSRANQEFVNGQRMIWMHPSGFLLSQQDGAWVYEQPSPHSQPAKPCYSMVSSPVLVAGNQSPYMQTSSIGAPPTPNYLPAPPMSQAEVFTTSYYPALPSPTYTYVAEPMPATDQSPPSVYQGESATLSLLPSTQDTPPESNHSQSSEKSTEDSDTQDHKKPSSGNGASTEKDIVTLEEQTKQLTLGSTEGTGHSNSPRLVRRSAPNGIIPKSGSHSPFQPKRPPRYQNKRPPALPHPLPHNFPSPLYQPNYAAPPLFQGHLAYGAAPPTMRPPQYPINPVSNISTLNFTPPLSPNLGIL